MIIHPDPDDTMVALSWHCRGTVVALSWQCRGTVVDCGTGLPEFSGRYMAASNSSSYYPVLRTGY